MEKNSYIVVYNTSNPNVTIARDPTDQSLLGKFHINNNEILFQSCDRLLNKEQINDICTYIQEKQKIEELYN